MKKGAVITFGSLLGIGSAGYYLYRSFSSSDHSLRGTLKQCKKDLSRDVGRVAHGANRVASWALSFVSGNRHEERETSRSHRAKRHDGQIHHKKEEGGLRAEAHGNGR